MVSSQMFLVSLIGIVLALAAFWVVKLAINEWFSIYVLEIHRDNLDIIGTLDLLPFNLWYLVGVWSVGLLATVVVARRHLRRLPLRDNTAPSELLQS